MLKKKKMYNDKEKPDFSLTWSHLFCTFIELNSCKSKKKKKANIKQTNNNNVYSYTAELYAYNTP